MALERNTERELNKVAEVGRSIAAAALDPQESLRLE